MLAGLRKNARLYASAALIAATALVWYVVLHEERGVLLTVAFLDVGQGDAALIEGPTGMGAGLCHDDLYVLAGTGPAEVGRVGCDGSGAVRAGAGPQFDAVFVEVTG